MYSIELKFTTPCGHEATVKPCQCQSKSGPNAGNWVCKIRGPNITLKSGVKTKYCQPDEASATSAIASVLGIDHSFVIVVSKKLGNNDNANANANAQHTVTTTTAAAATKTKMTTTSSSPHVHVPVTAEKPSYYSSSHSKMGPAASAVSTHAASTVVTPGMMGAYPHHHGPMNRNGPAYEDPPFARYSSRYPHSPLAQPPPMMMRRTMMQGPAAVHNRMMMYPAHHAPRRRFMSPPPAPAATTMMPHPPPAVPYNYKVPSAAATTTNNHAAAPLLRQPPPTRMMMMVPSFATNPSFAHVGTNGGPYHSNPGASTKHHPARSNNNVQGTAAFVSKVPATAVASSKDIPVVASSNNNNQVPSNHHQHACSNKLKPPPPSSTSSTPVSSSPAAAAAAAATLDTKPAASPAKHTSPLLVPTAEQEVIYAHTKPPTPMMIVDDDNISSKKNHHHPNNTTSTIIRITAGAGAGKTTTILNVAVRAAHAGHTHITYVTFSKAAATDGRRRIVETLKDNDIIRNTPTTTMLIVEARTLHSCAMRLLSEQRRKNNETEMITTTTTTTTTSEQQHHQEEEEEVEGRLFDEEKLEQFIKTVCQRDIEKFLDHHASRSSSQQQQQQQIASSSAQDREKREYKSAAGAHRQVLFFIKKTLTTFCQSEMTLGQFKDPACRRRNYYPATKFHEPGGDGEARGFPTMLYYYGDNKVGRYADMACKVWEAASEQNVRTYDFEMKRAQLLALRIPGTLLLVDESQDLDGCQSQWIAKQVEHGIHVYLVGDAAQTIYSFRGAKSKHMMNVKDAKDCTLTKSWRFGPKIANIANIILFAKEKSPQTTGNSHSPIWKYVD
jgi:ATP:corrinoid adenosyltransferase